MLLKDDLLNLIKENRLIYDDYFVHITDEGYVYCQTPLISNIDGMNMDSLCEYYYEHESEFGIIHNSHRYIGDMK